MPFPHSFVNVLIVFFLSFSLHSLVYADDRVVGNYITIHERDCEHGFNEREKNGGIHLDCRSYHQTTNYTCGPAAIMTLMRYYGRLSESQMNQKTELHIALEMGATSEGTTLTQVSDWLSAHGFHVDSGMRVSTDMIVDNLKRNTPTLVGFNRHWILAKGFNKGDKEDNDEILFADSCCGTTIISRSTLDSLWESAQLNHDHCAGVSEYIVATPA